MKTEQSVPKRRHIKSPLSILQHFSNLVILHLPAYEYGTMFRNVGIYNSDAGTLPKRKHKIIQFGSYKFALSYDIE